MPREVWNRNSVNYTGVKGVDWYSSCRLSSSRSIGPAPALCPSSYQRTHRVYSGGDAAVISHCHCHYHHQRTAKSSPPAVQTTTVAVAHTKSKRHSEKHVCHSTRPSSSNSSITDSATEYAHQRDMSIFNERSPGAQEHYPGGASSATSRSAHPRCGSPSSTSNQHQQCVGVRE